jgi:hypothetical protein
MCFFKQRDEGWLICVFFKQRDEGCLIHALSVNGPPPFCISPLHTSSHPAFVLLSLSQFTQNTMTEPITVWLTRKFKINSFS